MAIEFLPIKWDYYHSLSQKQAAKILSSQDSFDEIVAISRGGLTFGHLMSDLLRIPISTICIQSYSDIQTQGEVKITAPLQTQIAGRKVLLVDDVADSGKTLLRATEYLRMFGPKSVKTLTMFYKPSSIYKPDFYAEETMKWILFPYEPTEMIGLIWKDMAKEGKSSKEIKDFLRSLLYSDEQIEFVQTCHIEKM